MDKATGKTPAPPGTETFERSKSAEGVGRMEVLHAITVWYAGESERQSEVVVSACCIIA